VAAEAAGHLCLLQGLAEAAAAPWNPILCGGSGCCSFVPAAGGGLAEGLLEADPLCLLEAGPLCLLQAGLLEAGPLGLLEAGLVEAGPLGQRRLGWWRLGPTMANHGQADLVEAANLWVGGAWPRAGRPRQTLPKLEPLLGR
jgi:hypothetical protein